MKYATGLKRLDPIGSRDKTPKQVLFYIEQYQSMMVLILSD